ncbi:hypothetical protein B0T25DRAFT_147256 [Lasiosphaeria hispida]|uniref:Subtelomeric hrmA-associated cluster protein AFUB-079030/YDR124W-like helical bundle domain-containing protein n=1 Tax=Lasiosphaeria hispida TaxID=260671 RepID=A0AAJ0HLJ1_9PEZI|nr:hypothetical protein B0T25DRAFT_147256 [Lasiosphaeria hispida]
MVTDWIRGQYHTRPHWQAERPAQDHIPDDGRFYEPGVIRSPPLTIGRALREQCNINYQSYFLAVLTEEGEVAYFSGPENLPNEEIPRIFQMQKFLHWQKRATSVTGPSHDDSGFGYEDLYHRDDPPFASRRRFDRHRDLAIDRSDDDVPPTYRTRKRQRANLNRRGPDDDEPPVITRSKKGIKVGNSDEVWDFYGQRFRNIQQNACKLIAKAWVKAVAPKKQTNNPYTAGDDAAPDWWPKPWGPTKDDKVRHLEPDHLLKKERVYLLTHILRLIVEPNASQHPDIQKLNINVAALEEVTTDALSSFFNDKDNTNNAKKKPFLREIFKVARHEEQYKRGEIDANTEVFVMADDKIPDNYQSDDEAGQVREDEENNMSVRSSRASPPRTTAPHSIISASSNSHSPVTNLQNAPFMGEIPVRGPQYPSNLIPPDLSSGQHSYVDSGNMAVGGPAPLQAHGSMHLQEMIPSPHDSSRRPSLFNSPATEFPSPSGPGLYSGNWQQGTTAPGNAALYAYQQPPPQPPGAFVPPQGVPLNQGTQYLSNSYHGLPHPNDVYRGGNVGQSPVAHGSGYANYISHDGRTIPNNGMKIEPLNRGPLH